ncbi:MAG: hypothetical protein IJX45_06930 [Spirochaetaceae bacterium]|nr:hypothetical protein [Spirochaetaceae bacterium]
MKRLLTIILMTGVLGLATAQISTGGSVDVNFGSDMKPQGTGSWNLEYRFLSIASAGIKLAGQTDFEHKFAVTPTIFARLYPFSGAFAEINMGGKFNWQEKVFSKNFTMGGSVGWRISSGKTYIEPKINFDYAFGAKDPFNWSGGVGAGYSF